MMSVAPFLLKDQVRLVTHKQLVASVAYLEYRGIHLVTVADSNSVEETADERYHRVVGAVAHTRIHHFLFVCVLQARCHIYTVTGAVGMRQHGGVY